MGLADKRYNKWLALTIAVSVALGLVAFSTPAPARAAISQDSFESCLLEKLNAERTQAGAVELVMAYELVDPVRHWSEWMRFNDFEHMTSSVRNQILPDSWTTWGENIAMHSNDNMSDCTAIHDMWMNSAGHRANILNPSFRYAAIGTYVDNSGWWATQLFFNANDYTPKCYRACDDELFFYRDDGEFAYYDVGPDGTLGDQILGGGGYTDGWSSITSVDLDGDSHDEVFFYRDDGLFRYYDIYEDGTLGSPILFGNGYTRDWTSITATDLDGDGQDEMFFYREDGLFRYYNIHEDGTLGSPILSGDGYTQGWSSIAATDLDGDGQDEMFFYREDGLFRYYQINPDGTLGSPMLAGSGYTQGWSSITATDLDGDGQDEMFFYREDGLYRYYNVKSDGSLGQPLSYGADYAPGWSLVSSIEVDGQ